MLQAHLEAALVQAHLEATFAAGSPGGSVGAGSPGGSVGAGSPGGSVGCRLTWRQRWLQAHPQPAVIQLDVIPLPDGHTNI